MSNYRADAWPVIADSEFDMRSQNSFYKKTDKGKKEKQEDLLEEYLQRKLMKKLFEQEKMDEMFAHESQMSGLLKSSDADKAYNHQFLYKF